MRGAPCHLCSSGTTSVGSFSVAIPSSQSPVVRKSRRVQVRSSIAEEAVGSLPCRETGSAGGPPRPRGRRYLLEGDHIRAAQCWGFWLQGLVRQVAITLIQYLIEPDDLFVVGAGGGRIN